MGTCHSFGITHCMLDAFLLLTLCSVSFLLGICSFLHFSKCHPFLQVSIMSTSCIKHFTATLTQRDPSLLKSYHTYDVYYNLSASPLCSESTSIIELTTALENCCFNFAVAVVIMIMFCIFS